jgi:DNA-binding IclR family transcriptional regulator
MNAIDPLPEMKSKAPAVDGALDILATLTQSSHPLSLLEIAERVDIPVATCHRIIGTLLRRELVVRNLQRKKSYCIGAKLFQMASAAYFQQPIVALFHSIADVLKNELHEAVNLSVPAGSQALVVAHVSWPFADSFGIYVGMSHVLHPDAAGKAMMSMRPASIRKHYLEAFIGDGRRGAEPASITLEDWLLELAEIKRVGYALTRSQTAPGVFNLAAPVLNRRGEPLAAMGVCFTAQKDVRPYVTPLVQATWQLSSRLG